jgi:hypothetical protein
MRVASERTNAAIVLFVSLAAWAGAEQRLNPRDFLPDMNQPVEPLHIVGNVYYVGPTGSRHFSS